MRRLTAHQRACIEQSALFVAIVTPNWLTDPVCQAQAAYATALGKPIRLLLWPGVHLPDEAFLGVTDLQIARHGNDDTDSETIRHWIDEWRARPS